MKIVFLDVDGVLNHACTKERFQNYNGIDEENLQNFAEFILPTMETEYWTGVDESEEKAILKVKNRYKG